MSKKAHQLKHPVNRGMRYAIGAHVPSLENSVERKVVGKAVKDKF